MRNRRRETWPIAAAVVSIVVCGAAYPAYADWVRSLPADGATTAAPAADPALAQQAADDGHDHSHTDPATKNALSRTPATAATKDPTTAAQATASRDVVAKQRAEKDPTLVPAAKPAARTDVPADRYAMAGGCYALQDPRSGRWVARSGAALAATATSRTGAAPLHFQATDLGTYLLYGADRSFVAAGSGSQVAVVSAPSEAAEWTVQRGSRGFTFATGKGALSAGADGTLGQGPATAFALRRTTGCAAYPEISTNVRGGPFAGTSRFQEVRGYLDAHTHGMAFEFLGGKVHCGRPWHKYGVEHALQDCDDHKIANGTGAILENFMRTGAPVGTHDPVGWPTFKDWPAPDSLTHEGTYYKWLERSWRGGQRILVNLLVENNQLCNVYPLKKNSCDDMTSIRLQAKDMRELERYIDAQNGGPGKGWYRIVTSPWQARQVINQGKLAVVMGVETSVLFGCSSKLGRPTCTTADIDRQLDELHTMGVRQMELVNKFDNGLAGVAGDSGAIAPLVNAANFLETGSFWDMRACAGTDGVSDRTQLTAVPSQVPSQTQDALFGGIAKLSLPISLPIYPSGPTCNARGLTSLGDHTITQMAKRKMIFDPDHMSVAARKSSLDLTERLKYPGVVSSHSWSTPDAYPRIYRAGGVITPYAGDSAGFVAKWREHLRWADPRYYFGFGYGADINGLGAQGNPRGADAKNPVTYPFRGLGGVTIDKNTSGSRTYDINTDGVSHYGLYPDWVEDLRRQGGNAIAEDMARGAEAYLQMWERAEGARTDACRDRTVRRSDASLRSIARRGTSVKDVLLRAGQPHTRLGRTFGYCAWKGSSRTASRTVTVTFTSSGRVASVR
ncbi:MAG: hypothetical protein PGN07_06045 [Aeromicrobium erythreum]